MQQMVAYCLQRSTAIYKSAGVLRQILANGKIHCKLISICTFGCQFLTLHIRVAMRKDFYLIYLKSFIISSTEIRIIFC